MLVIAERLQPPRRRFPTTTVIMSTPSEETPEVSAKEKSIT
jgi:hypothetical protein